MFTHVVEVGVMGDLLGYQHYHNANASTRALDESFTTVPVFERVTCAENPALSRHKGVPC